MAVPTKLRYLARMAEDFLSARAFSKMHSCACARQSRSSMLAHSGEMSTGRGCSTRREATSRRCAKAPAASCATKHMTKPWRSNAAMAEAVAGEGPIADGRRLTKGVLYRQEEMDMCRFPLILSVEGKRNAAIPSSAMIEGPAATSRTTRRLFIVI